MKEKQFALQPLRISDGWTVCSNQFSEYDPVTDGQAHTEELMQDLLQLRNEKAGLMIDLGWYPEMDINGRYCMYLLKPDFRRPPLKKLETKSRKEIINALEKWQLFNFYRKFLI